MKRNNKLTLSTDVSKREALKKAGIYAAFTVAASTLLLVPKSSQAVSPPGPGWGKKKR
jgi:hypothetical protein